MHQLLRQHITPQQAADVLDAPVTRLQAYKNFVENHIVQTINKNFSLLKQISDPNKWQHITHTFYLKITPKHYELNQCVEAFIDFIANYCAPEEQELALLEWHEWLVFSQTTGITPSLKCQLNPTLSILTFDFNVVSFAHALRHNQQSTLLKESETAFIFRDPKTHGVMTELASPPLLFAFKTVHDDLPLEEAASQANISFEMAQKIIHDAMSIGLVL